MQEFKNYFEKELQQQGTVGGSYVLFQNGTIADEFHYGFANKETKQVPDNNTIYHWASITKTLTGIALMQLVKQGKLKLEDKLVHFLPELLEVYDPFGSMNDITIKQVMQHTAGFRAATWPWGGHESWHPHEPQRWEQLVAMMPYTKIEFKSGTKYSYSNLGIVFLGMIIEKLSGLSYAEYIAKHIFSPLKLSKSYFNETPNSIKQHRSSNYYLKQGKLMDNGIDFNTGITVSNGGWNASVSDMVLYMCFLLGVDKHDEVLDQAHLRLMWGKDVKVDENQFFKEYMGLTFFVLEFNGKRIVGHTGSQKGFMSFMYIHPETGKACCLALNTAIVDESTDSNTNPTRELLYRLRARLIQTFF